MAQVYTLATFLLGLAIFALLTWASPKKVGYFYLAWLAYSISLGTHPFVLALLPGIVYFVTATDVKIVSIRNLLICLGLTALGVLQYLCIPLRASAMPLYSEIKSGNLRDFWIYVTYYPKADTLKYGLAEIIGQRIPVAAQWWQEQFFLPGILIGLAGAFLMARRSLRMAIFIVLVLSGNAAMYLNHGSSNIFVYPVVSYMFYTIFIAEAFSSLRLRTGIHPRLRGALSILVLCLLLAFPAALDVRNHPLVDQSENGLDH